MTTTQIAYFLRCTYGLPQVGTRRWSHVSWCSLPQYVVFDVWYARVLWYNVSLRWPVDQRESGVGNVRVIIRVVIVSGYQPLSLQKSMCKEIWSIVNCYNRITPVSQKETSKTTHDVSIAFFRFSKISERCACFLFANHTLRPWTTCDQCFFFQN